MDTGNTIALSATVSTIITTIVIKAVVIIQKKTEFTRELEQVFFVSKLKAGEEMYAQLSLLKTQIRTLTILFSEFKIQNDDEGSKPITESIIENLKETEIKINTIFSNSVYAFGYFFNDDQKSDSEFESIVIDLYGHFKAVVTSHAKSVSQTSDRDFSIHYTAFANSIDKATLKLNKLISKVDLRLAELRNYTSKYDL